jgi:uracil-DNA glycosylase family 4
VDAHQDTQRNPFDMDEACQNCETLAETRTQVVHGYGDVGAEFCFVGGAPAASADRAGTPFGAEDEQSAMFDVLDRLGFCAGPVDTGEPPLENAFLTYCTRCRHPDRGPTDTEVRNCDGFLTAEIRMINPEILVPVGSLALETLGVEYTTTPAEELSIDEHHATTIRGRGFELVPMREPEAATDEELAAFLEAFEELMGGDYRQTKGRRER